LPASLSRSLIALPDEVDESQREAVVKELHDAKRFRVIARCRDVLARARRGPRDPLVL
jgi:hypothetical protein